MKQEINVGDVIEVIENYDFMGLSIRIGDVAKSVRREENDDEVDIIWLSGKNRGIHTIGIYKKRFKKVNEKEVLAWLI